MDDGRPAAYLAFVEPGAVGDGDLDLEILRELPHQRSGAQQGDDGVLVATATRGGAGGSSSVTPRLHFFLKKRSEEGGGRVSPEYPHGYAMLDDVLEHGEHVDVPVGHAVVQNAGQRIESSQNVSSPLPQSSRAPLNSRRHRPCRGDRRPSDLPALGRMMT